MRRLFVLFAAFLVLGLGVASFSLAQDTPGTPMPGADVCASPQAGDMAASPQIDTSASPEVVASEVVAGIASGLGEVVCASPFASPGP